MGIELTVKKRVWFKKIRQNRELFNKNEMGKILCQDKDVLDIGCVGQDIDYSSQDWIHNQIKNVSKSLVGVDINIKGINNINQMGYEIYHYDKLNRDKKFDILIMLDVIEHVNDPVEFLNNYKKFLKEDGKIIVTTPNSNRAINFVNIFFRNDYSLNYEHTFWFCPKTFLEIVNRVDGLEASEFYWLNEYIQNRKMTWKGKIIYYFEKFLIRKSSSFSPNFMFILEYKK